VILVGLPLRVADSTSPEMPCRMATCTCAAPFSSVPNSQATGTARRGLTLDLGWPSSTVKTSRNPSSTVVSCTLGEPSSWPTTRSTTRSSPVNLASISETSSEAAVKVTLTRTSVVSPGCSPSTRVGVVSCAQAATIARATSAGALREHLRRVRWAAGARER
jgi:hypothetical protein